MMLLVYQLNSFEPNRSFRKLKLFEKKFLLDIIPNLKRILKKKTILQKKSYVSYELSRRGGKRLFVNRNSNVGRGK